jgi:hypothetical protein
MFCEKYADWGILYLYDELEAREKELFGKHLANCKHCQAELTLLQESKTLARALPADDIAPDFYPQLFWVSKSDDNFIAKYKWIISDFIESIFQTRPRLVFVPAVVILFCLILIYLSKPSVSSDPEMLFAWDTGWEESFDRLDQKIAQFKLDYSSTKADLSGETSDYSAVKVNSDDRIDQLKADIESLTNELSHSNF